MDAKNRARYPGGGRFPVEMAKLDYSTPVTTLAYTEVVAEMPDSSDQLEIFDSSGGVLKLAIGAPGEEVDQFYILPGGNGIVDFHIPVGSRVSVIADEANATTGFLYINFYSK